MRAFLSTIIWTLKDDRFSWRFKLCNIITNDRLRWATVCIAIANGSAMDSEKSLEDEYYSYKNYARTCMRSNKQIRQGLEDIWRM